MKAEKSCFRVEAILGFLFVLFSLASSFKVNKPRGLGVGINYGRLGSNLPLPGKVLELVKSLSIKHVKTYDMDPLVTEAFANSSISLSLCVPNQQIQLLASNLSEAKNVVRTSILPFYNRTRIYSISIGNEVSMAPEYAQILLPAMENMYTALRMYRFHKRILVSTPHSLSILAIRSPPSAAVFQESIAESVLRPLLAFLNKTRSPFMMNFYPYLTYKESPTISLEFALFPENTRLSMFRDPNNGLTYTNLFDLLLDALISAASSLGFHDLPLVVTETGWPSQGSPGDSAASVLNAAIYNQRLIKHVSENPIKGTPLRPGIRVPTYIFSLFDEDMKIGLPSENHWGVLYANGTRKYILNPPNLRSSMLKEKKEKMLMAV